MRVALLLFPGLSAQLSSTGRGPKRAYPQACQRAGRQCRSRHRALVSEVMCMPAQVNEEQVDRTAEETNEVLLRGRLSGAPEERVLPSGDTVWTFRVVIGRPPEPASGSGSAALAGRHARVRGVVRAGEALGAHVARRRCRGGRRRAATTVLQVRRGHGLAGGGRRRPRQGHPSRSDRMSTPRLGFGWKEVAFSGSSRSWPAMSDDLAHVGGRHQHGHAEIRADLGQGVVDRVVVADPARPVRERRHELVVQHLDRCLVVAVLELDRGPPLGVGDDQLREERARRWRRSRTARWRVVPTERAASSTSSNEVPAKTRWIGAEEERGVVLVDQHGQALSRRSVRCPLLQPQVGGVAVMAVRDQGARAGQGRRRPAPGGRGRGWPRPGAAASRGR